MERGSKDSEAIDDQSAQEEVTGLGACWAGAELHTLGNDGSEAGLLTRSYDRHLSRDIVWGQTSMKVGASAKRPVLGINDHILFRFNNLQYWWQIIMITPCSSLFGLCVPH